MAEISALESGSGIQDPHPRPEFGLESGSESAMKEFLTLIRNRISKLIGRVRGQLSMETRIKVITIITIDVHSRDVIKKFVD